MDLTTKELKAVKHILKLTNGLESSEEIKIINDVLQKAVDETENLTEHKIMALAKEIMTCISLGKDGDEEEFEIGYDHAREITEIICPGYFDYPF